VRGVYDAQAVRATTHDQRAAAWRGDGAMKTSLNDLEEAAASLRLRLDLPPHSDEGLRYDGPKYTRADGTKRSWCHWLVPDRLMVGRYPHQDPTAHPRGKGRAFNGPTPEEAEAHIYHLVRGARISCFVSLVDETPPQDDNAQWPRDGLHFYQGQVMERFPSPFVRYYNPAVAAATAPKAPRSASDADEGAAVARADALPPASPPTFLHFPMRDCSVPWSNEAAYALLAELLLRMDEDDAVLYVHCWGGRGRAGLVGGALLALLRPELSPADVLRITQAGYDSRAGAGLAPARGRRSPQPSEQVEWLQDFATDLQHLGSGK
jgi:alanine transaminase